MQQMRGSGTTTFESAVEPTVESTASQLATLSRLHDEGKLTGVEFEAEKGKLLGRP